MELLLAALDNHSSPACEHEWTRGICEKEVRVHDYADLGVPMLANMFDRRCAGYEAVGYSVHLPGSAVPGWPIEVPLPIDARWKQDYSVSVRRLVRDGVDAPLARLFADTTCQFDPNAEGIAPARSATEAFLFQQLDTLPETSGQFRLNAQLPIPFDGWGKMEVDLLCHDARLAIELDGHQHLSSEEAYRRDRHKDALLQEHGYFVLRFLAEDVGRRLDDVLDAILRTMTHRQITAPKPSQRGGAMNEQPLRALHSDQYYSGGARNDVSRCQIRKSGRLDLNQRPLRPERSALPD